MEGSRVGRGGGLCGGLCVCEGGRGGSVWGVSVCMGHCAGVSVSVEGSLCVYVEGVVSV